MSEIREKNRETLIRHYGSDPDKAEYPEEVENLNGLLDTHTKILLESFHISEKLTNEEMEKINTIMCDFKTNFYGHGVEENAEYLEDIINKLTGVNNERSSNTTNRR